MVNSRCLLAALSLVSVSLCMSVVPLLKHINVHSDFSSNIPSIPPAISPLPVLSLATSAPSQHVILSSSPLSWATCQLSWTVILLASFLQVAQQMANLEESNLGRFGFMGGCAGANMSGQMIHRHGRRHDTILSGVDNEDASLAGNGGNGNPSDAGVVHRHSGICAECGSWILLGLRKD